MLRYDVPALDINRHKYKLVHTRVMIYVIVIVFLLFVFVYGIFDPARVNFFPVCPFRLLTGLKCPGCVFQRAIHQLLRLHFSAAFRYNAFLVISIPLLVFLLMADLFRYRFPRMYLLSRNPILSWEIVIIIFYGDY
jgi:hypothetical protein